MTYDFGDNATTATTTNLSIDETTMSRRRRRYGWTDGCLLFAGLGLCSLGAAIFLYFDAIYDRLILDAMTFDPNSEPYRVWRKNDPPLDMDIYLFNWTNPEELRVEGKKPKFVEMGPYRFKEIKEKINVTWHPTNGTVSFKHKKLYFFDSANSARQLTDVITTINAVPLTIAYKARHSNMFLRKTISFSLTAVSSLHVTKTAAEILFDGYEEPILSVLSSFPLAGVQNKFGLFYGKNDTNGEDGWFNMYTTTDENYGRVSSWNFNNRTNFYGEGCDAVRGSAGEFYPINRERDHIEVFSSELCKFAKMEYEQDVRVKGVLGYKYTARNIFDNGTTRPDNRCFCTEDCRPSGVFNVSICRQDSPILLSMPHFYGADPYYINAIEGLSPNDEHEFYITLQPKSGIVIDITPRMQVNMLLQPIKYIKMYEDVPEIVFPIFYFTQRILLKDKLVSKLLLLERLPDISTITVFSFIILGLLASLWLSFNVYCHYCQTSADSQLSKQKKKKKLKNGSAQHEEFALSQRWGDKEEAVKCDS